MMGQSEVALSKPRSVDEYRKVLESNLEEQGRLARLIDALLFLARADNAQTALVREPLEVSQVLDAVIAFFDAMAQDKKISLVREGHGQLYADASYLRRALTNLVSNAIRHTPVGGHIKLIATQSKDGTTQIRVVDDGVGIAPEQQSRVFDRFYRSHENPHEGDGGVGLGLAIVQSIMTLHGGSVEITSTLHRGTTAILRFPNWSPRPSAATDASSN
jgi:two-component system, OmpR family, heavy metal sensor histidine kinase CusS